MYTFFVPIDGFITMWYESPLSGLAGAGQTGRILFGSGL